MLPIFRHLLFFCVPLRPPRLRVEMFVVEVDFIPVSLQ